MWDGAQPYGSDFINIKGGKKKVNPVWQNSNGADISFQPLKISTVNDSTVMKFDQKMNVTKVFLIS